MHRQLSDIPAGVVVNQVDSKTRLRPRKRRLETKTSRNDKTKAVVLKLWGVDEQGKTMEGYPRRREPLHKRQVGKCLFVKFKGAVPLIFTARTVCNE